MTTTTQTDATLARFIEYARDARNWGGTPLVGGNVGGDTADKGYIVNMKLRGWAKTYLEGADAFLRFTAEGKALAAEHGVTID